ncbi:MAG: YicC family protein [Phycisphaerae bacterium]|jgi:uncharacterized protein (TIGR00255 family)|nr:YicC family protein [Phycisphaerae bacterium]MDP6154135.1 YicC/YloC family endoribonuclease [Phycisphaeraceae bacterium]
MIHSMTGFGRASAQVDGTHYTVEVRSLNNRYFKAAIRLPEELAALDAELESNLRKRFARGSVTLSAAIGQPGAEAAHHVNDEALMTYLAHLENIHAKVVHNDRSTNIDMTQLLALPGVLQPAQDQASLVDRARPHILKLTEQACDEVIAMRATEGKTVVHDVRSYCDQIEVDRAKVIVRAPSVIEDYQDRLRARIDQLAGRAELKLDEPDLIREIALFAERADISEELSRIAGHLEQIREIVSNNDDQPAGRTLDFLTQELLREANTIASKSNDSQISQSIVRMKGAIDRVKEQVQNVE